MDGIALLVLFAALFAAITAGLLAVGLPALANRQVHRALDQLTLYERGLITAREVSQSGFLDRAPLVMRHLAEAARRLSPVRALDGMKRQLVYAGVPREIERYLAGKTLILLATVLSALGIIAVFRPAFWPNVLIGTFAASGFFAPDVWLARKAASRQKAIRLAMPGMLDVLAVSVEAGLGFDMALAKLVAKSRGPLAEEFARMLKEMQMGIHRKGAFKNLGARVNVTELQSFLAAMIQADVFGISIADTLKVQAQEMRIRRYQRAEEMAQKAPVKLVFPTILCIFPALFVVVLGPAAIRIYNSILTATGR